MVLTIRKLQFLAAIIFVLAGSTLLQGCADQSISITNIAENETETPNPTVTALVPTSTPIPTYTQSPTLVPTNTPAPSPTITPTALPSPTQKTAVSPIPGIIFRTESGIWQVNKDGESAIIFEVPSDVFVDISSDGTQAITESAILDLKSGREFNEDINEEYVICCTTLWPEHPNTILVEVQPGSQFMGMGFGTIPARITMTDENPALELLGENPTSYGPPSISPDGKTLAFDQSGIPWLYNWDDSAQPFDLSRYKFPEFEDPIITHPAWSTDSKQLAWIVAGKENEEWQHGIGLFVLQNQTSQFLFPFDVEGYDGGRSLIYWNPTMDFFAVWNHGRDLLWILSTEGIVKFFGEEHSLHSIRNSPWNASGEWLAYTIYDPALEEQIVYVTSADGTETKKIGPAQTALWSPDGNWLITSNSHWRDPSEKHLFQVGKWEKQKLDLPDDSYIVDWVSFDK